MRRCVICQKPIVRKEGINGIPEDYTRFTIRQTCGNIYDIKQQKYVKSECSKQFFKGAGNPNYKGYMPKCERCGKSVSYFSKLMTKKRGRHYARYCERCYGISKQGVVPEHLKPFVFKKGKKRLDIK